MTARDPFGAVARGLAAALVTEFARVLGATGEVRRERLLGVLRDAGRPLTLPELASWTTPLNRQVLADDVTILELTGRITSRWEAFTAPPLRRRVFEPARQPDGSRHVDDVAWLGRSGLSPTAAAPAAPLREQGPATGAAAAGGPGDELPGTPADPARAAGPGADVTGSRPWWRHWLRTGR